MVEIGAVQILHADSVPVGLVSTTVSVLVALAGKLVFAAVRDVMAMAAVGGERGETAVL